MFDMFEEHYALLYRQIKYLSFEPIGNFQMISR